VADFGAADAGGAGFFGAEVARGVAGGAVSGGAVVAGGAGGAVGAAARVVGDDVTGGSVPTTPVRPPVGTTGTVASVDCVVTASCFS
jgi:hypothetical protein